MPSIYIVLESPEPDFDVGVDGTAFSEQADQIGSLCEECGLLSPYDFFGASEEELGDFADIDDVDDPEDPDEEDDEVEDRVDDETWFAASVGLDWISELRAAIADSPGALSDEEAVLEDLSAYEDVLVRAQAANVGWHFGVDY